MEKRINQSQLSGGTKAYTFGRMVISLEHSGLSHNVVGRYPNDATQDEVEAYLWVIKEIRNAIMEEIDHAIIYGDSGGCDDIRPLIGRYKSNDI